MIVTNENDYEWDIDNQFSCAGFPERNKKSLQQMKIGDKIIYYETRSLWQQLKLQENTIIQKNLFGMMTLMTYGCIEFYNGEVRCKGVSVA